MTEISNFNTKLTKMMKIAKLHLNTLKDAIEVVKFK